jgi:hypothetical protein
MLAYVFWHWKQPDIATEEYESRQRAFHTALSSAPPPGFLHSFCAALTGAPWALEGGQAYEDWYYVDNFAALGELNEAAVAGRRAGPHDAAAAIAAGGAGGLYSLRLGSVSGLPRYAHWFGKPNNMEYQELFAELAPIVEQTRGRLWMRQLVLGPAREFCLHAATPVPLPAAFGTLVLPLRAVWPESANPRRAGNIVE